MIKRMKSKPPSVPEVVSVSQKHIRSRVYSASPLPLSDAELDQRLLEKIAYAAEHGVAVNE
jgi:hypothetical protein